MIAPKTETAVCRHPRTLLLVEAEDEVRLTAKWFLSNLGYTVDSASSGGRALEMFNPAQHAIVIAGQLAVGINPQEFASAIKSASPLTPILVYSNTIVSDTKCVDATIQRPAHLLDLARLLSTILNTGHHCRSG